MWPFSRTTARQREIRRSRTEREGPWYRRVIARFEVWSLALTLGGVLLAALILNAGGPVLPVRAGEFVPRPIVAEHEFQLVDPERTTVERNRARESAPNVYVFDVSLLESMRGKLINVLTPARSYADDKERVREEAARSDVVLDAEGVEMLIRLAAEEGADQFQRDVDGVCRALSTSPLVDFSDRAARKTAVEAALIDPKGELERLTTVKVSRLRYANNPEHVAEVAADAALEMPPPLRASIKNSIIAMLRGQTRPETFKPLYRFNLDRTTQAEQDAAARVPTQMLTYRPGAILADAGEIDAREIELLRAERAAVARRTSEQGAWVDSLPSLGGYGVLAMVVVLGMAMYLVRFQPRLFRNPWRQSIVTAAVLGILALARGLIVWTDVTPYLCVGLQALIAAMLALIYTRGAVFALCASVGLLMTLALNQDAAFFIVLVAVSGTFVLGLNDVRNRGKIVGVGVLAAFAALATTLAAGLVNQQGVGFILRDSLWAAGATLAAAFVIEGVLPGLERLFKFSTSVTLLEWCDGSKPLLRSMAADAPGTYNHSLLVGAMAEAAAEAIGANGLLCRAGAYYHDIGKINKPEYFAENQPPGVSRHERLSPAMSLLIIVNHVKDGIEMVREYGLPAALRPFIAEHHGTTIVEYFYHLANKQRRPDDPEVADTEYRYPGPKPQSRETAVVMLCDAVEGAVRAMAEPTPGRIEAVVHEIVQKRLLDGQFDECDLTFRELGVVERSLVKSLCGLYHARIVYPEAEKEERDEPRRTG